MSEPARRRTGLEAYIAARGAERLAADLGVTRQAVDNWRHGRCAPRPRQALRLARLSAGELSVEDVYRGFAEIRETARATTGRPRPH